MKIGFFCLAAGLITHTDKTISIKRLADYIMVSQFPMRLHCKLCYTIVGTSLERAEEFPLLLTVENSRGEIVHNHKFTAISGKYIEDKGRAFSPFRVVHPLGLELPLQEPDIYTVRLSLKNSNSMEQTLMIFLKE